MRRVGPGEPLPPWLHHAPLGVRLRPHCVLRRPHWALPTDVWGQRFLPSGRDDSAAASHFLRFPVIDKVRGDAFGACIGLSEYQQLGERYQLPPLEAEVQCIREGVARGGSRAARAALPSKLSPNAKLGLLHPPATASPMPRHKPRRLDNSLGGGGSSGSPPPRCKHNLPCVLKRINKEGPNRGRYFFGCSKYVFAQKCNFFRLAPPQSPSPSPLADATEASPSHHLPCRLATPPNRAPAVSRTGAVAGHKRARPPSPQGELPLEGHAFAAARPARLATPRLFGAGVVGASQSPASSTPGWRERTVMVSQDSTSSPSSHAPSQQQPEGGSEMPNEGGAASTAQVATLGPRPSRGAEARGYDDDDQGSEPLLTSPPEAAFVPAATTSPIAATSEVLAPETPHRLAAAAFERAAHVSATGVSAGDAVLRPPSVSDDSPKLIPESVDALWGGPLERAELERQGLLRKRRRRSHSRGRSALML